MKCSDSEVVELAQQSAAEDLVDAFASASALGAIVDGKKNELKVNVELSLFREFQSYDETISKRYCEATSFTTVRGMGQFIQMGLVVNGIDPRQFENGIEGTLRYSIQLTEDGTQLVGLEEE